ncbi:heme/hemin ABC transporter substrate-binding protein [Nocardiopsis ansamitocini]|uniref:ABC transporter substrate-binding protein n=1 Tax=Nocardiopsis ansamitocini TaxID=1670832 RepID=A0A9W6ULU7_9ACTN|nr:ABC transporter substrate-binding protein [Nocardiopsis ansamitocini]
MLAPALLLAGCAAPGPSASEVIPDLAENRLQPLEGAAEPRLPVTVDSIVPVEYRTSDTEDSYEKVEVADVSRILPLTGAIAEVVYTLGLGDNVVGRDVTATFDEAADLPVVSQGHEVSAEGVLALEPTLILADTWTGPYETVQQLRASGVTVVIVDQVWSLDEMYPRINQIAELLGVPERGEQLVERTQQQMADVRESVPDAASGRTIAFLYLRGSAGVYLLGGPGSGADALLAELGAKDAGTESGLDKAFSPITTEALIAAQPDVILVMSKGLDSVGGLDGIVEIPGIAQTPAGRNRRVIDYEDGLLLSFGPRTPQVLKAMGDDLAALYEGEGA